MNILGEIQNLEPGFTLEWLLEKLRYREEQRLPYIGTKAHLLYLELQHVSGYLTLNPNGSFVTNIASIPSIFDKVGLRYILSSSDIQGELLLFDFFKGSILDFDSKFISDYNQIAHLWSGIVVPKKIQESSNVLDFHR